mmetsp:Transcript_80659/g.231628  ORF Transcript_80659/g.231628 Transcript_80659/m.231628 type:complete len:201 (-) Transcript_80659:85-687(-)
MHRGHLLRFPRAAGLLRDFYASARGRHREQEPAGHPSFSIVCFLAVRSHRSVFDDAAVGDVCGTPRVGGTQFHHDRGPLQQHAESLRPRWELVEFCTGLWSLRLGLVSSGATTQAHDGRRILRADRPAHLRRARRPAGPGPGLWLGPGALRREGLACALPCARCAEAERQRGPLQRELVGNPDPLRGPGSPDRSEQRLSR